MRLIISKCMSHIVQLKFLRTVVLLFLILFSIGIYAQKDAGITIDRRDKALDLLISSNATIETVASGFGFTEGVTWVQEGTKGYLLFSDIPANVIYRWYPNGKIEVYLEKTGYQHPDIWRVGMSLTNGKSQSDPKFERFNLSGSNGMTLDNQGNLLIATWAGRSIVRIEKNGLRTVVADRYQGKKFNGPNDLVVNKNGVIYFTDTFGGLLKEGEDPSKGIETNAIYMIQYEKITRVVDDIKNVNGLAFSPDQQILYANGSIDRFIRRYNVLKDGTLTHSTLLIDLSKESASGITDGMKVDSLGNIWTSGPGGIWVINPQGKVLGVITLPEDVTNLVFGGADKKTLYVSAHTSIYMIPVLVAGLP
ncbi:SMP-30/gluconolactonase/LRE family protein [Dysgonomonas sp. HDW5B]|uniref:SMP-30/gluconolactonase/LRE family protein n=1 Tax=Dysgonomonas sp. HDW5B TaxID=2714927 RepID=UPI00140CB46F|nr:SMP-30/gluconolactonase/LRE family protein [Dysgonomonas sp. HDW5B]QIK53141.1 SMP-30/gluconolactonase/LRE family protein [Dysgonomonas sp. HDW5B]